MRSKLAAAGDGGATAARHAGRAASRPSPVDARLIDLDIARDEKLLASRALLADARAHSR
jgi:hypothetical protein